MREGSVFRRCACGATSKRDRCPECGRPVRWRFKIDVGADGGIRTTRSGTFETRREAVAKMHEVQQQLKDGLYSVRSQLTTGEYMSTWLAKKTIDLRPSTHAQYEAYWRRLEPHLGGIRLQSITTADIRRAYSKLEGLSDGTLHSHHITMSAALNEAVKDKLITENPASGAHKSRVEPKTEVWSRNDIVRFRSLTTGHPLHLLFACAVETGLRRGEVLGIRWRDIDYEKLRINVTHQVSSVPISTDAGRRSVVKLGPTKTRRSKRSVPIGERLARLLEVHAGVQRDLREMLGISWSKEDLVFSHPDGRPLTPTSVTRVFRDLVRASGLPLITFHGLRRSFAAVQLSRGTNPATVSRALGHSRPAFTLLMYSPFLPIEDEEAIRRVAHSMAADDIDDELKPGEDK